MPLRRIVLALLPLLAYSNAGATTPLTMVRVAQGLSLPLFVASPPGDTTRLFVLEQREPDQKGYIKIVKNGSVLPTPFLITPTLADLNEQGLLGLAFAPDYATSGRFYVNYTDSTWATKLVRYTVSGNPDVANPTGTIILSIPQPYSNHNGGWLGFGPDGYLYMATGDGGNAGDPEDRAQNVDSLLGKILRLDVSGSSYTSPPTNPFFGAIHGRDEIWEFGLRNPWRPSFDRETGELVIADVGQSSREEVNAPTKTGGLNFGWRCWEGSLPFSTSTSTPCTSCTQPPGCMVFPAYDYDHTLSRCSITGGYVYRGCAIPDLRGTYFFADYCGKQIYTGRFSGGTLTGVTDRTAELAPAGITVGNITSFGEDAKGELYVVDQSGQIFKVVPKAQVLEADMPALRARTALGDTLGSTSPGNALAPGITAFADPGSRVKGSGYLKDALLLDCTAIAGSCLTARARLSPFDIDLRACVDSVNATLTRRFIFRNTSNSSWALQYTDVVAPQLNGNPNSALTLSPASGSGSAVLTQADSFTPSRWIVQSGIGSAGVAYSADVDTAAEVQSRVALDQPLGGGTKAEGANVALALGFDFGLVAPAAPETVTVVTHLQNNAPSGVDTGEDLPLTSGLRVVSGVPFRSDLRLEISLPHPGHVLLDVFDTSGRRIRALHRGTMAAGVQRVAWDGTLESGRPAPSGIYFVQLRTDEGAFEKRVVLLR